MVFAYIMIVLLVAFLIFAIVMVVKGVAEQRREEEKHTIARYKQECDAQEKKAKELEYLAGLAKIESKYKSADTLAKELCFKANNIYQSQLSSFRSTHNIIGGAINTYSVLLNCMVSPTTFYYGIKTDLDLSGKCTTADLNTLRRVFSNHITIGENSLPLSDIIMYKIEGARQFVTEASGGGTNLQGAVVGGLLFGGAAAIIGSQVGTEIKTTTKEIDSRSISLYFNLNGQLRVQRIGTNDFEKTLSALRQLIPQKEESVVQMASHKEKQLVPSIDELKKYKELFDSGIITQEEFDNAKKQLLGHAITLKLTEENTNLISERKQNPTINISQQFLDGKFRFIIEDVFSITNLGTVVSGTVEVGQIFLGESAKIQGQGGFTLPCVIDRIEKFREPLLNVAKQGDSVGLQLRGVRSSDVHRGDIITK